MIIKCMYCDCKLKEVQPIEKTEVRLSVCFKCSLQKLNELKKYY